MFARLPLVRSCVFAFFVALVTALDGAPSIRQQPHAVVAAPGTAVVFSVSATGIGQVGYQWRRFGCPLPGEIGSTLSIPSAKQADVGFYDVVVADSESSIISAPAQLSVQAVLADTYRMDTSFLPCFEIGSVQFSAVAVDGSGRIYVGGGFSTIAGQRRHNIARFRADLENDATFIPVLNGAVNSILIQGDGKILIGGMFTKVNGISRGGIARLNSDGSLDPTFDSSVGFRTGGPFSQSSVTWLQAVEGGKVRVFSANSTYNNVWIGGGSVVRLNADGTLDSTGLRGGPVSVVQPDGKTIVASGGGSNGFRRYNADGSEDYMFNPGGAPIANGAINAIAVQADGKIVVAGAFSVCKGAAANRIARLNPNGTRNDTFAAGAGLDAEVKAMRILPDGRIAVAGGFTTCDGHLRRHLAVLAADGSCDTSFVTADNSLPVLGALAVTGAGDLVVAGSGSGDERPLAVFAGNGSMSALVAPGNRAHTSFLTTAIPVAGEKWLVGGEFFYVDGLVRSRLVRLNADGTVDPTFAPDACLGNAPSKLIEQGDGKVLALVTQATETALVRFNSDGSRDAGFSLGSGPNYTPWTMALLPDGRIAVGGKFTTFNGQPSSKLVVLSPDGSRDPGFEIGNGFDAGSGLPTDGCVTAMAVQPDGRLLVGGTFGAYNGNWVRNLARLNPDGSFHAGMSPTNELFGDVLTIVAQPVGGILLGGNFYGAVDGVNVRDICRLGSNLRLDYSYAHDLQGVGVRHLVALPGGEALADARWSHPVHETTQQIVRLNALGGLIPAFATCDMGVWSVQSILPTDDGRILVIGPGGGRGAAKSPQIAMLRSEALPVPSVLSITGDQIRTLGDPATISVVATGEGLLAYEWWKNGYRDASAATAELTWSGVRISDSGEYVAVVRSEFGVARATSHLTVVDRFEIIQQPPAEVFGSGGQAWLEVVASGTGELDYQWYRGNTGDISKPFPGADSAAVWLTGFTSWDRCWVRVTQGARYLDSRTVLVKVIGGPVTLANWAMQQGTSADQRGAMDAPAGDGICNLLKFAYGVAPMTELPSSWLPMSEIVPGIGSDRHLALSFIRNTAAQGIVLELEVSTDLQTWTVVPATLEVVFPNGPASDIVRLRETAPISSAVRRFARLAVRVVP